LHPWKPNLRTGRLHGPSFLPHWRVVLEIPNLNSVQVNVYINGVYVAPGTLHLGTVVARLYTLR
jgi:hypothetical protein